MLTKCKDFATMCRMAIDVVKSNSVEHHRSIWQGANIAKNPSMKAFEVLYLTLACPFPEEVQHFPMVETLRTQIRPNLPWADDHFDERVGGVPLNPGVEWRNWPWGKNADKFRLDPVALGDMDSLEPIFDHTYQQRYWPKRAGHFTKNPKYDKPNKGIYFDYGDLGDVVEELYHEPTTRQAILPVFFPEDTGYRPRRRKPCSLFYHFQLARRDGRYEFDIVYSIRSCDLVRHFRDDVYLTARLHLWVLEQLKKRDSFWLSEVTPGMFVMLIDNLHIFVNDWPLLKEGKI